MILDEKNLLKNILEFKNDLLKKINSLESRLTHKINLHDKDFSLKLESLSEKILPISTDLSTLIQSSSENDKKLEKLEFFEKFKNKAESALLSQNIRLNKSFETISEMKAKFPKLRFIEHIPNGDNYQDGYTENGVSAFFTIKDDRVIGECVMVRSKNGAAKAWFDKVKAEMIFMQSRS